MTELLQGEKTGLKTAIGQSVRPDDPVPGSGAAEQLPLLPLSQIGADENGTEFSPAGRGRGRPAGSMNKSTKEWTAYLLGRYQSPLIALFEIFNRPIMAVAEELGYLKRGDQGQIIRAPKPEELEGILKLQAQAAKEVLPYVHQRQPMAIEAGDQGLMTLVINTGATPQQVEQAGHMPIQFLDAEIVENQEVSGEDFENSNAAHSNGERKAESYQQDTGGKRTD